MWALALVWLRMLLRLSTPPHAPHDLQSHCPVFQVVIKNVHIRFEDYAQGGAQQAFGITIARVSGRSADANWQPK